MQEAIEIGYQAFVSDGGEEFGATKHFRDTQHPVMRAIPPAAWIWCYVHETQGVLD